MSGARLIANFAAEESDWLPTAPDVASSYPLGTDLWRASFPADARCLGESDVSAESWPEAFGTRPTGAAFRWLEEPAAYAWINTPLALEKARSAGLDLAGAMPDVVRAVHDKAFAHRVAVDEGLLPEPLRDQIAVLDAELLAEPARAREAIEAVVSRWPAEQRRSFTLKPRLGTSGRGRVAGRDGRVDVGPGAFSRLAAVGGALVEPWLSRTCDLSTSLWVEPGGELVLLGTMELLTDRSGLYRGHRGFVDSKGRLTSGSPWDESLREASVCVARAAAELGYRGPCGVDAFVYEEGEREVLRPVVEFNARFTFGVVVAGLLRRALPTVRAELALDPNERRAFAFTLDARDPPVSGRDLLFELATKGAGVSPRLVIARDAPVNSESIR